MTKLTLLYVTIRQHRIKKGTYLSIINDILSNFKGQERLNFADL